MKTLLRFALPLACMPAIALAIYAPIPEQEQGKALTYRLGASAYHDSNIFGAPSGAIDSMVYISPRPFPTMARWTTRHSRRLPTN